MVCIILCSILGIVMIAGIFYTKNYEKEFIEELDQKEHGLKFLYPLSLFLITKSPIQNFMRKKRKQIEVLSLLYVSEDEEIAQILYWCKKIAFVLLIFMISIGLCLTSELGKKGKNLLQENGYFIRQENGMGNEYVDLEVSTKEHKTQTISVVIPERTYSREEAKDALREAKSYVLENYLGENQSEKEVTTGLYFMEEIPGSLIQVSWQILDGESLQYDGKLDYKKIPKDGEIVNIIARLYYEDMEDVEENINLQVHIIPKTEYSEEEWKEVVESAIEEKGSTDTSEKKFALPQTILEQKVDYKESIKSNADTFFVLGIIAAIGIWFFMDQDLESKKKKHDEEMMMDYPDLVNKFTLLLGAGMTVGSAWEKIAREYLGKKNSGKIKRRYAYEEWCLTWYEMQNGVTEMSALEKFGKRVQLLPYLKFSSLLSQNLKKGSKGLLELLEYEALDAFEERKQMTKRLAEEASTKLLAPMMVMLGLVMVIIMVPAMMAL